MIIAKRHQMFCARVCAVGFPEAVARLPVVDRKDDIRSEFRDPMGIGSLRERVRIGQ